VSHPETGSEGCAAASARCAHGRLETLTPRAGHALLPNLDARSVADRVPVAPVNPSKSRAPAPALGSCGCSEVLAAPGATLGSSKVEAVAQCYKQLNSSVGEFGTSTLKASTRALESTSDGDQVYLDTEQTLTQLEHARDAVAERIKRALDAAEFAGTPVPNAVVGLLNSCRAMVAQAEGLGG
jgi:hypothetical protein